MAGDAAPAGEDLDSHDTTLQTTFDHSHAELEKIRTNTENGDWLGPNLDSAQGTQKIYSMLQKVMESPQFLEKISSMCQCGADCSQGKGCCQQRGGHDHTHGEVLRSDWWEAPSPEEAQEEEDEANSASRQPGTRAASLGGVPAQESGEPIDQDYVMIEKEDVIEAMSVFIARYVVALPEAQDMEPKVLQRAVSNAFIELRMGRIRRLWSWGKYLYRCTALGYSAFSMYQHPWIVAAVLRALYTSSKFIVGSMVAVA
mmetsp:Transcript_21532/g.56157  ORF Transcript_21532/g.56157 Transcript_21532/m.56157 type:complete len:257 (+) Transcript_21532:120-890(+)